MVLWISNEPVCLLETRQLILAVSEHSDSRHMTLNLTEAYLDVGTSGDLTVH